MRILIFSYQQIFLNFTQSLGKYGFFQINHITNANGTLLDVAFVISFKCLLLILSIFFMQLLKLMYQQLLPTLFQPENKTKNIFDPIAFSALTIRNLIANVKWDSVLDGNNFEKIVQNLEVTTSLN